MNVEVIEVPKLSGTELLYKNYDVVVIGGGAAGLGGALTLARARRSVLVIDGGQPRNAPAAGVHALLGLDGIAPGELVARGQKEVCGYGGQVVTDTVTAVSREDDGDRFVVTLADGRSIRSRRLLVATGVTDELPDIPGLRERWGRDVVHCPYCHGWEVRDRPIGVLATGPMAIHQVLLFRQWSEDIVFFTNTADALPETDAEKLTARGIRVITGPVAGVDVAEDRITGVRMADGSVIARDVVALGSRMVARTGFLDGMGLRPVEHPAGIGEHIPADASGHTEVPGVWVAGNITEPSAQVGAAAAAGTLAGARINADLVEEDTERATAAVRG